MRILRVKNSANFVEPENISRSAQSFTLTKAFPFTKRTAAPFNPARFVVLRHGVWAVHGSSLSGVFATGGGDATVKIWAQKASTEVADHEAVGVGVIDAGVVDGTPSEEHGQQHHQQRWECVGGVRGTAGAVGTVLMNEQALTFGTSEALIASFPLQLCMPAH